VVARLKPQLPPGRLLLSTNAPRGAYDSLGLPIIGDAVPGRPGPLAGVLAAMQYTETFASASEWVLSAPVDTPFLSHDLVSRLCNEAAKGEASIILAASAGGLCQVCGLWQVALAKDIAAALAGGQNKVLAFVEAHRWARVEFPPEPAGNATVDPFFNVNTPADLASAAELLQSTPQ
jgi:molybdenum cofactor guanylyltransferase